MYRVTSLNVTYGDHPVLHDISCDIPINSIATLLGPSGSGKSTLLRQLAMIETPSSGTVELTIDGQKFPGVANSPWPTITCVFQKQFLWPHLSVYENIALPLRLLGRKDRVERIESLISQFDMSDFVKRYPNQISGGQAQRAALARAIALRPKLLLIDEPHTGLDIEQISILNNSFSALRNNGIGIIIVTHSMLFVKRYSGFIVVLENGKLSEAGDCSILNSPKSHFLKRAVELL